MSNDATVWVSSLEAATHKAIHSAVAALALHLERDRGHDSFHTVRPKLAGWAESHYRYAAIKDYVRRCFDTDETSASNILFSYRNGISVDTPCAVCGKTTVWGSYDMTITRPCGHAVCRSVHKQESKSRCIVCRKKITGTFTRDNMFVAGAVLQSYYDGFIADIGYNNWFRTHFYYKLNE